MDIKDAYIFKKMIFSSVLGRRAFCNVVILSVTFLKNLSTTLLEIGMSLKSMYVVFEAVLCCFCPSNSALMPQLAYFSSSTSFCPVQSFNFKHISCSFSSLVNGYTLSCTSQWLLQVVDKQQFLHLETNIAQMLHQSQKEVFQRASRHHLNK